MEECFSYNGWLILHHQLSRGNNFNKEFLKKWLHLFDVQLFYRFRNSEINYFSISMECWNINYTKEILIME